MTLAPPELPQCFEVDVTWTDIREGVACSTHLCPLARALSRALWERHYRWVDVSVGHHNAEIAVTSEWLVTRYWHSGIFWIDAYDRGLPVEPCTVRFEVSA